MLPHVHPQSYQSLLNHAVKIEPGRIVTPRLKNREQGLDNIEPLHRAQSDSRPSTIPPLRDSLRDSPHSNENMIQSHPPTQAIESQLDGPQPARPTLSNPDDTANPSSNVASPRLDDFSIP
ncbi:hypothetical protein QFC19_005505 [Naganishia cerealis]|uniref:Uncharacterized protein n=1 Tax=Naganishia cerealis TaxID=610337 RepID=A0ACC2VQ58_9TREE|nr:hypothetical protein QFC19_005505 [Naganishia cerealis]